MNPWFGFGHTAFCLGSGSHSQLDSSGDGVSFQKGNWRAVAKKKSRVVLEDGVGTRVRPPFQRALPPLETVALWFVSEELLLLL